MCQLCCFCSNLSVNLLCRVEMHGVGCELSGWLNPFRFIVHFSGCVCSRLRVWIIYTRSRSSSTLVDSRYCGLFWRDIERNNLLFRFFVILLPCFT